MRFALIAFVLLAAAAIKAHNSSIVYLYLMDSSKSTKNTIDGQLQFLDFPTGINSEIPYNTSNDSNLFFSVNNFLIKNVKIPSNRVNKVLIQSVKTYWRHSGYLPLALVQEEMKKSKIDPLHIADLQTTMLSVDYLFYKMRIPAEQNPSQVKHQLIEICAKVQGRDYRHFVIDRGYRGVYPNIWNSKIRLIYTGNSTNCSLNDSAWADVRAGNWSDKGVNTSQLHLLGQGTINDGYDFSDLANDAEYYLQKFPAYNTLYNSQHFGTNLFNYLTGQNLTFVSKEVMVMNDSKGVSNLKDLLFSFISKEEVSDE